MPPDEYTEYHENVLQSYRHKQLNTQLQEYTELPAEAIWWHRMQEKLSAAGAPDPAGELTALHRPPSWWGGRMAASSPTTPCCRPFGPRFSCSPTPELCPHLSQAGDDPESHIGYD